MSNQMTEDEAERLSILLLQVVAKLDQSAAYVQDKDSSEEWIRYRTAVGKAMGEICLELAEPLWKRFPRFKPEQLGGTYEVSPEVYEPRFYDRDDTAS